MYMTVNDVTFIPYATCGALYAHATQMTECEIGTSTKDCRIK